jgi:hypothetical protein
MIGTNSRSEPGSRLDPALRPPYLPCSAYRLAPESPKGRIPADATPVERIARKLKTKKDRAVYAARRNAVVEPVFGQINTRHTCPVTRTPEGVRVWKLMAGCHNLLKLFRYRAA